MTKQLCGEFTLLSNVSVNNPPEIKIKVIVSKLEVLKKATNLSEIKFYKRKYIFNIGYWVIDYSVIVESSQVDKSIALMLGGLSRRVAENVDFFKVKQTSEYTLNLTKDIFNEV